MQSELTALQVEQALNEMGNLFTRFQDEIFKWGDDSSTFNGIWYALSELEDAIDNAIMDFDTLKKSHYENLYEMRKADREHHNNSY